MECEVEGSRPRGRPNRTWIDIVQKDCQVLKLNREDAIDRNGWRKQIKRLMIRIGVSGWMVPAHPDSPLLDKGHHANELLCVLCDDVCCRIAILTTENKTVKQLLQTVLDKGHHDKGLYNSCSSSHTTKQLTRISECDMQIWYPLVEMATQWQSPNACILTERHQISMLFLLPSVSGTVCLFVRVGFAQKLTADVKLLEQDNELLKQKVEAGKAR